MPVRIAPRTVNYFTFTLYALPPLATVPVAPTRGTSPWYLDSAGILVLWEGGSANRASSLRSLASRPGRKSLSIVSSTSSAISHGPGRSTVPANSAPVVGRECHDEVCHPQPPLRVARFVAKLPTRRCALPGPARRVRSPALAPSPNGGRTPSALRPCTRRSDVAQSPPLAGSLVFVRSLPPPWSGPRAPSCAR